MHLSNIKKRKKEEEIRKKRKGKIGINSMMGINGIVRKWDHQYKEHQQTLNLS